MERFLVPVKELDGSYSWPDLQVKLSNNSKAGFGLFAKTTLHKNTFIPYYGQEVRRPLTKEDDKNVYLVEIEPNFYIDGTPELRDVFNRHIKVGSNGKAAAAMANEPASGERANAVLVTMGLLHPVTGAYAHLITTKRVRSGEEITVDYNFTHDAPPRSYSKGLAATW